MADSYTIYPSVDDEYNFSPEIRQAMAESPELASQIDILIDAGVPPAVTAELASNPAILASAVALAQSDAGLARRQDPGMPKADSTSTDIWGIKDIRRRKVISVDAQGRLVAPVRVSTPLTGVDVPADQPILKGTYDALRRKWLQDSLGPDGRLLQETIDDIAARLGTNGGGTRFLPHPLTLSAGTNFNDTATSRSVRIPVKFLADVMDVRFHIRNRNDRASQLYLGAINFKGIGWGDHALNAFGEKTGTWTTAPAQIQSAFSTPANADEWISGWTTINGVKGKDYLFGTGYDCAAQTNHAGIAGGWVNANSVDAFEVVPANALTKVGQLPFDIWIECRVSANVKAVAFFGDSLTCGTGSTLPVYDSYPRVWGLANDVWAVHYSHHGSTMYGWAIGDDYRWTKYGSIHFESVFWALGSNDIFDGTSLVDTKTRFGTVLPKVKTYLSDKIFLATIKGRNGTNTDAPRELVRSDYSHWLFRERPGGAMATMDFGRAAQGATVGSIDPDYVYTDGVHLNTEGYAKLAEAITGRLV